MNTKGLSEIPHKIRAYSFEKQPKILIRSLMKKSKTVGSWLSLEAENGKILWTQEGQLALQVSSELKLNFRIQKGI